jgi:hypothetical protein
MAVSNSSARVTPGSLRITAWQAFRWNVPLNGPDVDSQIQIRWTVWNGSTIPRASMSNTPVSRLAGLAEYNSRSLTTRLSVTWSRTCGRGPKISVRLLALYAHARPMIPGTSQRDHKPSPVARAH